MKFPKEARLRRRSHFLNLGKQGSHLSGSLVRMEYRRSPINPSPKLGITCSKRYGKAHERNRFKRVVREAFRHLYSSLPSDLELNIFPKKNPPMLSTLAILNDLESLLRKIVRE